MYTSITGRSYNYTTPSFEALTDFYGLQGFRKRAEDDKGNTVWEFIITDGYEKKNRVIEINSSSQGDEGKGRSR